MTEAARLVDELTTLLYEVIKRWQLPDGRVCEIVRCGACRRKADRTESVVHESDCPVYRLIRAEAANTAVIRANAEEIADLEDRRDELEAQVNALTAEIERERQSFADLTIASVQQINALTALLAERDADAFTANDLAILYRLVDEYTESAYADLARDHESHRVREALRDRVTRHRIAAREAVRAALAARGGAS